MKNLRRSWRISTVDKEVIYHRALAKEFILRDLPFQDEPQLPITYKNETVGRYVPDFVIDDKVLIEIKAVPEMPKVYEKQLYYYLKVANYKLGFLANFGAEKLDIRRRILG